MLGLVPARGGSTRVERKNLARLGGTTLVRRALETALAAGCFDAVALSSDDAEILAEAVGLDVVVVRRPDALATDTALVKDAVLHALHELEDPSRPFGAVALVQCTSPFTAPEDIAATVRAARADGGGGGRLGRPSRRDEASLQAEASRRRPAAPVLGRRPAGAVTGPAAALGEERIRVRLPPRPRRARPPRGGRAGLRDAGRAVARYRHARGSRVRRFLVDRGEVSLHWRP